MKQSTGITVTLKAAASVDGKIATGTGHSKWVTGDVARRKAHQLRHENDAILVGINTILTDDPELTVRGIEKDDLLSGLCWTQKHVFRNKAGCFKMMVSLL